jgi:uncharacterized protein YndB with AHSA1/START domain
VTKISTHHGTVVVERTLDAPIALVYGSFADPKIRASWGAPSDTAAFYYEETDFKVGGRDVARCGPKEDPRFRVEARYIDIAPEQRVVWTEVISDGDMCLAVNVTTMELDGAGAGTRLKVTAQVTSFVGAGMIQNTEAGHKGSMASMARFVEGSTAQR